MSSTSITPTTPTTTADIEFARLKTKLVQLVTKNLNSPEIADYLVYHLHITFEINFPEVLKLQSTQSIDNVDNNTTTTTTNNNNVNIDTMNNTNEASILRFVHLLQQRFGLNNFTTISLPLGSNKSYIQYLTTCKFSTKPSKPSKIPPITPTTPTTPDSNTNTTANTDTDTNTDTNTNTSTTTITIDEDDYEVFTYYNTLLQLQQTGLIDCIGFKIEGVIFPNNKSQLVEQVEAALQSSTSSLSDNNNNMPQQQPQQQTMNAIQSILSYFSWTTPTPPKPTPTIPANTNDDNSFCYYETHRKVPTIAGLELQPNELVSFSFKNNSFMSAFREYDVMKLPPLAKYEVCIYETWIKDIEAPWKNAHTKDGDFLTAHHVHVDDHDNTNDVAMNINVDGNDHGNDHGAIAMNNNDNNHYDKLFIKCLHRVQQQEQPIAAR